MAAEKRRVLYLFPRFPNYTSFGVTLAFYEIRKLSLKLTFDASNGEEKVMLKIFTSDKILCEPARPFPFLPVRGEPNSLQGIYLEELEWRKTFVSCRIFVHIFYCSIHIFCHFKDFMQKCSLLVYASRPRHSLTNFLFLIGQINSKY